MYNVKIQLKFNGHAIMLFNLLMKIADYGFGGLIILTQVS